MIALPAVAGAEDTYLSLKGGVFLPNNLGTGGKTRAKWELGGSTFGLAAKYCF